MQIPIGQIIDDKYRIVSLIGEGGMGAVYEGENIRINRRVAIKILHAAVAGNKEAVQRFEREAQAAGRIGNDHILEVLDLGSLPDGQHYMVMEFLEGEPLSARIRRLERLTPEQAYPVIRQVLQGLDAAHSVGIVHRDLKPDNVFIIGEKYGQRDFVKIIDFGVSKFSVLSDDMKMTRTGAVVGTPYYMAPEQASGSQTADARSDVYAVGVILYECITGHVPFDAATFNQLMFQIVLSAPIPAEQIVPNLDPAFATIIGKAMARDPAHRFASCSSLIQALDAWVTHRTAVSVPPAGDPYLLVPRPAGAPAERMTAAGPARAFTPPAALPTPAAGSSPQTRPVGVTPPNAQPAPTGGATLQSEPAPPGAPSASGAFAGSGGIAPTPGSWSSSGLSIPKSRVGLWIAAVVGLIMVAAALFAWTQFRSGPEASHAPADASPPSAEPGVEARPAAAPPAGSAEPPTVTPAPADAGMQTQVSAPSDASTAGNARTPPPTRPTSGAARVPAGARPRTPSAPPAQPKPPAPRRRTPPDFGY
ncbi:MAG: protein kinase [Polyangiaceae bacterium]|nr:protein kinase [Polyangiaceae bacterium]